MASLTVGTCTLIISYVYREDRLIKDCNHHQLATSVDAMALVIYNLQEQRIKCFCAVELKTATATVVQRAERLADVVGKFVFVDFNRPGSRALFFRAVPDVGHRCQVIHHAVTAGTFFSLYVVSSTGETGILRMVLIRLPFGFHQHYITPILDTFNTKLPWVYNETIPIPILSPVNLGYFGEMSVLTQHLTV